MARTVRLRRVGGSLAAAIPEEIARLMNVGDGDELHLVQTEHGFMLASGSVSDADADRAVLNAFDEVLEQYDETFRRLAQ